ncbi:ATP-binding protein [Alteromonas oceanisediminis]|uniref:ATP-binding protein n=1 Tax=Alteromonas oceanisediminis TaxID=2836180 RepID=UPI001BD9E226|nr:ATP-binding protein [Alteromonas oceanisediminis]MBT0587597.1 response regulator [Alteromonas oceanisediminis]
MIRLPIVYKLFVPVSLLFIVLTAVAATWLLSEFRQQQIDTTKTNLVGIASQAAMQFDASIDEETLKRVATMIALSDHVLQTTIVSPQNDTILATSRYRHANHQLPDLPALMRSAYAKVKYGGSWYFTPIVEQHYALAYPLVAIAQNGIDSNQFVLLIYIDTYELDAQFTDYRNTVIVICSVFLAVLITALFGLIHYFVRKPLNTFESALRKQTGGQFQLVNIHSNDEFSDIAIEFNRMREIEVDSLAAAEQARQAAEALAAQKTQFLANMSHELRTPINGILGLAQLMETTHDPERQRSYLTKLISASNILLSVVNDILDFSKLSEKGMRLRVKETTLFELLENCVSLITVLANKKSIQFKLTISSACPFSVHVDAERTQQVLLNVLNNAVKFTHEGDVHLTVNFTWHDAHSGELMFIINDSGVGIAEHELPRLFMPFEQLDNSASRKAGGTGLGLSISKRLLELMQGKISVRSEAGEGTEFTLRLPCQAKSVEQAVADAEQRSGHAKAFSLPAQPLPRRVAYVVEVINQHVFTSNTVPETTPVDAVFPEYPLPCALVDERALLDTAFGSERTLQPRVENEDRENAAHSTSQAINLLVAEDNDINAVVIQEMLIQLGYSSLLVENGQLAIDAHKKHQFDLILMDIQMPVMDGLEATRQIRQFDTSTPIVGLSANVLPEDRELAEHAGMTDYLNKPVKKRELEQMLSRHLVK